MKLRSIAEAVLWAALAVAVFTNACGKKKESEPATDSETTATTVAGGLDLNCGSSSCLK
jgi:hypothetical protein